MAEALQLDGVVIQLRFGAIPIKGSNSRGDTHLIEVSNTIITTTTTTVISIAVIATITITTTNTTCYVSGEFVCDGSLRAPQLQGA